MSKTMDSNNSGSLHIPQMYNYVHENILTKRKMPCPLK